MGKQNIKSLKLRRLSWDQKFETSSPSAASLRGLITPEKGVPGFRTPFTLRAFARKLIELMLFEGAMALRFFVLPFKLRKIVDIFLEFYFSSLYLAHSGS